MKIEAVTTTEAKTHEEEHEELLAPDVELNAAEERLVAWYTNAMRKADDNWQEELKQADARYHENIDKIKDKYARMLRKLEAENGK